MTIPHPPQVRIGIVGPSWWVDYWHLPALRNNPHATVVGVCGERSREAGEVKAKYGAEAVYYTSLEQMLDTEAPHGVIVCTPNDLHHPSVMAALRCGIHVTCEKPLALNAAQAREMAETAARAGLIGMTNFPYRGNPAVQRLRELLRSGCIGVPLHIYGAYNGGFGLTGRPGWRGGWARSGAGILGDLGSHLIDLIRFTTGREFRSVCSHGLTLLRDDCASNPRLIRMGDPAAGDVNDDSCAFLAELDGGMQAILHTSWAACQGDGVQHQELEVTGTEGRLRVFSSHRGIQIDHLRREGGAWEALTVPGTSRPEEVGEPDEDYFRPGRNDATNTTYRWIEAIRDGRTHISPSLEDGWRAQEVIDAVIAANADRKWVDIQT